MATGSGCRIARAGGDHSDRETDHLPCGAGFPQFASPLMVAAMKRANRKDLRKLRAILEASVS